MGSPLTLLLMAAAGFFFMLANLALKLMGHMPVYILYPAVGAAVIAGCWFEVVALREVQFGLAVVLILGLEMLFSVLVARAVLGEIYSSANIVGIMLVIVGMGLVHLPAGAQTVTEREKDIFRDVKIGKGPRPKPADAMGDR